MAGVVRMPIAHADYGGIKLPGRSEAAVLIGKSLSFQVNNVAKMQVIS